jgi:DNA-binding Xre family transcriptional regulator
MLRLRKYRILEIMDEKGIASIKELGARMDTEATNISSLFNNKTNFTRDTIERLLSTLECDISDVLEFKVDQKVDE